MVSIRDYADSKNISYEAVRQQVKRYQNDLVGHIQKIGRRQYLDDDAVAFLDEKRKENPIILMQADKDDEIRRLQDENKALLIKIAELQDALLKEKDEVKLLQTEKIALLDTQKKQAEQIEEPRPEKQGFWRRLFR